MTEAEVFFWSFVIYMGTYIIMGALIKRLSGRQGTIPVIGPIREWIKRVLRERDCND